MSYFSGNIAKYLRVPRLLRLTYFFQDIKKIRTEIELKNGFSLFNFLKAQEKSDIYY